MSIKLGAIPMETNLVKYLKRNSLRDYEVRARGEEKRQARFGILEKLDLPLFAS
jgi:hypothetical protein